MTTGILAKILEAKHREVAAARRQRSLSLVLSDAEAAAPARSLGAALRRSIGQPLRVIAEIKRASPSAGPIRPGADPAAIAAQYAAAGAAAISVLTDREFFDGDLAFLPRVRAAVDLPLLRKDFVVDEYQVVEARAAGADAVLLIAAALDDAALVHLMATARSLGMEALVEIHDLAEAERAAAAGVRLCGINHRDLTTFEVDLGLSAHLVPRLPRDAVVVAESGIKGRADLARLDSVGVHAVLVGETLMRAPSPGKALAELLGAP